MKGQLKSGSRSWCSTSWADLVSIYKEPAIYWAISTTFLFSALKIYAHICASQ